VPTVDPPDITPLAFNDAPNVPDIAQAFEWKPSENALPRTNDVPPQFRVPGFPLPTTAPAVAVARTPAARPNPVVRAPRVAARGDGSGTGNGPGAQDGYDDRGLPKPEYPAESKRRHEQGLVTLDVEVKPDGRPGTITIVDDAGYPRLADAAIAAVRLATFEAATIDGVAVVGHIRIPFRFVLQQ
jgi:protein TonB